MRLMMLPVLLALILTRTGAAQSVAPTYGELAEFYAPVIFQETHSEFLDYITRFDFDGDWNGANNWDNAYLYNLPACVYYAVIESEHHYFITYAFFHPRDYTAQPLEGFAPKVEHENDFEGCTLLVEKDGSLWGTPLLLETLAHDKFFRYAAPSTGKVHPGAKDLNGTLIFMQTDGNGRRKAPAVFIEAEGHGVKAAPEEILREDYEHKGVVYRFSGRGSEVPKDRRDDDVSYTLIPIEDTLWIRRYEVGENALYCCGDSFLLSDGTTDVWGDSFNGPIGGCAARPPWGWDEADDGPVSKGDWFRDPVGAYSGQLLIDGLAGKYLHNPYLDSNQIVPASVPLCKTGTENTTVSKAVSNTLWGIARVLLSGGIKKKEIGERAGRLFLTNTVLLEWVGSRGFDKWNWTQTGASGRLSSFSLVDEVELPLVPVIETPDLVSPAFNAPSQYFNRIIARYRSQHAVQARLFWKYDDMSDFEETYSTVLDFPKSAKWTAALFDLSKLEQWDFNRNIVKVKLEIIGPDIRNQSAPDHDSNLPVSGTPPLEINYLIFDRKAFADTFVR